MKEGDYLNGRLAALETVVSLVCSVLSDDQIKTVIRGIEEGMTDQAHYVDLRPDRKKGLINGFAVMRDVLKRDVTG